MLCFLRAAAIALLLSVMNANANAQAPPDPDLARAEVRAAERAFARSMAERDFAAFGRHIAEDTRFFGGATVLRGKAAVLAGWKAYFDGPIAPFSWDPDQVEVLDAGQLALSTGLVRNPKGEVTARFTSIWQRQADGRWLVVFDKGGPAEPSAK